MSEQRVTDGRGPSGDRAPNADQKVQYETGKGCLMFGLIAGVIMAAMIASIVIFGTPGA